MKYSIFNIENQLVWEKFIALNSPGALFQSWAWGNVQKKLGTEIWRLGLYERSKLIGITQVVKVRAKRGNFLHLRHGPIMKMTDENVWKFLWDYLKTLAKKENCWFIRFSPLVPDADEYRRLFRLVGAAPAPIHAMDAELCWVLDLGISEDSLLKAMRKTTRYEIKHAQLTKSLHVVASDKLADLEKFVSLYKDTATRHHFTPHLGIREEFDEFVKNKNGILLLGYEDQKLLAGAIILFYGNQAIYHHGASFPTKIPITYTIQWHAIRLAKKRGLKFYNFWGIAPLDKPSHPWQGITLFKKGFGGSLINYIHAHDVPLSQKYLITKTIETLRKVTKGY